MRLAALTRASAFASSFVMLSMLSASVPAGVAEPDGSAGRPVPAAPVPTERLPAGLDELFIALRRAPDALEAQRLEAEVFVRLSQSGSPTVDVLMRAAAEADAQSDPDRARALYGDLVRLAPEFAEGLSRAAVNAYAAGDLAGAEARLRAAVRAEPRHFAAWTGLATVLEDKGDLRGAAEAYREALFVNPWFDAARRGLLRVEARDSGIGL